MSGERYFRLALLEFSMGECGEEETLPDHAFHFFSSRTESAFAPSFFPVTCSVKHITAITPNPLLSSSRHFNLKR
jgi:hypothetical protein